LNSIRNSEEKKDNNSFVFVRENNTLSSNPYLPHTFYFFFFFLAPNLSDLFLSFKVWMEYGFVHRIVFLLTLNSEFIVSEQTTTKHKTKTIETLVLNKDYMELFCSMYQILLKMSNVATD